MKYFATPSTRGFVPRLVVALNYKTGRRKRGPSPNPEFFQAYILQFSQLKFTCEYYFSSFDKLKCHTFL